MRKWVPKLLTSPHASVHQKLDAIAELISPSPVLHLVIALTLASLATTLPPPMGFIIGTFFLLSLASLVTGTIWVIARHSNPLVTIAAFMYLPLYAIWKIGAFFLMTFIDQEDRTWIKTRRAPQKETTREVKVYLEKLIQGSTGLS